GIDRCGGTTAGHMRRTRRVSPVAQVALAASRVYIIPTNSAQSPSRMLKRLDRRLATEYITYLCIAGCLLETMSETRTPGFCALCKSRCGSILVARDGRFVGQEPN